MPSPAERAWQTGDGGVMAKNGLSKGLDGPVAHVAASAMWLSWHKKPVRQAGR